MLRPRAFAQPAKLVSTILARHVHAPLVLLDEDLAVRTLLRVLRQPDFICFIAGCLLIPLFTFVTARGHVRPCMAAEALSEITFADDFDALGDGAGDADNTWTLCWVSAPCHIPMKYVRISL